MKHSLNPVQSNRSQLVHLVLAAAFCVAATSAWSQSVEVQAPWARSTVPGQKAGGVFMKLESKQAARLVGAASPVAAFGEVHEMRMEDGVMKMRPLKDGLELPAGKAVELKPGGFHIMLMDLKAPLQKDTTIPVTLVFVDAKGVESRKEITVPVNAMAPMGGMGHMGTSH